MAIRNHERVGKALEFLRAGLGPFVECEIKSAIVTNTLSMQRLRSFIDASKIADEVIAHLSSLIDAKVTVMLEVEVVMPGGASDQIVRIVTENARTLKFTSQGFERE